MGPLWEASYSGGPGCVGLVYENEGWASPHAFSSQRPPGSPRYDLSSDRCSRTAAMIHYLAVRRLIAEPSHNGDRVIPTRIFRLQWC
jgi:hypothetical protein